MRGRNEDIKKMSPDTMSMASQANSKNGTFKWIIKAYHISDGSTSISDFKCGLPVYEIYSIVSMI